MKNLPKEKRDRLLLVGAGTLVCLVAIWYAAIRPQKRALEDIAKKTLEEQSKLGNASRLVNSTADIDKSLEAATQKLRNQEAGMASGDLYSWMILTVNRFRANRNVDIPQFSREVPAEAGILPKFPYKATMFNVRGTAYFHDFGKFLADFENNYPFIRVQNVELDPASSSSATSTGDAEKLAFKMEIVTLINPNTR